MKRKWNCVLCQTTNDALVITRLLLRYSKMVRMAGLEPARPKGQQILSL